MLSGIFLCGTGATGKTWLAKRLEFHLHAKYSASVVRGFYAFKGIKDEKVYQETLSPEDKLAFQFELFDYYLQKTEDAIRENKENGNYLTIFDRSPFDHLAYTLYNAGSLMHSDNLKRYQEYEQKAYAFLYRNSLALFYMPYPNPNVEQVEDGFRKVDYTKDTIVDALIALRFLKFYPSTIKEVVDYNLNYVQQLIFAKAKDSYRSTLADYSFQVKEYLV